MPIFEKFLLRTIINNNFCHNCHTAETKLRLNALLSENNFCKMYVISAKSQCIMTEKSIGFHKNISVMCHAAFAELRLSAFFSENNFWNIDVISVIQQMQKWVKVHFSLRIISARYVLFLSKWDAMTEKKYWFSQNSVIQKLQN